MMVVLCRVRNSRDTPADVEEFSCAYLSSWNTLDGEKKIYEVGFCLYTKECEFQDFSEVARAVREGLNG